MNSTKPKSPKWKLRLLAGWFIVLVSTVVLTDKYVQQLFFTAEAPLPQHDAELLIYEPHNLVNDELTTHTEFPIVPISEAKDLLENEQLVLGIEINGEARAYPLKMLTGVFRQVLNDELGGKQIGVTWDHLGFNGVVYDRELNGKVLTFRASNQFWMQHLLMRDNTGSEWNQMMGWCMSGENENQELATFPSVIVDFETWQSIYPDSSVLIWPADVQERFGFTKFYYARKEQRGLPFCAGISIKRVCKHYIYWHLRNSPLVNDVHNGEPLLIRLRPGSDGIWCYHRQLDDQTLEFELDGEQIKDKQTGSIWNLDHGIAESGELKGKRLQRIQVTPSYLYSWLRFHRTSEEWTTESSP